MGELITEYSEYEAFARAWDGTDETEARLLWQLLHELDDDAVLVQLPEWMADEKVGFVDGATPTTFVGRIDRVTDKAIRLAESAAARPLMKRAHRIQNLEDGIENVGDDPDRRQWLEDRLRETRREFETREDVIGLSEAWLPKSQLRHVIRRGAAAMAD